MAEKLLQTSSSEEISCTLQTDSVFSESEYLLLASDSSAKKSSKKALSTKSKFLLVQLRPNLRKNWLINV